MSAWEKIKNTIIREQTDAIDDIIVGITKSIGNLKIPRDYWTLPLEEWVNEQIHGDSVLKLTAQEYSQLKKLVVDLQESFHWHCGEEAELINDFRNDFNKTYTSILESKEIDLKIETTAFLVETSNVDFAPFTSWYLTTWHLPPDKFNEAMGDFWGDAWRKALWGGARGAAYGGALGAAAAGFPTGGAAAVPGGLIGAGAGALAGAGKGFLKHVWNWRQSLGNFEQTKEKALENLKKLKELGRDFDINPNFVKFLDSVINELTKLKAYRHPPGGDVYRPAEAPKPMDVPQAEPTATSPATPTAPPTPEEIAKRREEAKQRGEEKLRRDAEAKAAARKVHFTINSPKDILRIYKQAKADNDMDTLVRLSHVINVHPDDIAQLNQRFQDMLSHADKYTYSNWIPTVPPEASKQAADEEIADAEKEIKKIEAANVGEEETATAVPGAPPPKEPEVMSDEVLKGVSANKLRKYISARGIDWDKEWPKIWWSNKIPNANSKERPELVQKLKAYLQTKGESVVGEFISMLREGKSLPIKHQLNSMPIQERVSYFKSLLKS
jgi:hypothetical protein